jgi:hypothetical protein
VQQRAQLETRDRWILLSVGDLQDEFAAGAPQAEIPVALAVDRFGVAGYPEQAGGDLGRFLGVQIRTPYLQKPNILPAPHAHISIAPGDESVPALTGTGEPRRYSRVPDCGSGRGRA